MTENLIKSGCNSLTKKISYSTFQIANNKGADQTAWLSLCCSHATKSVFHIEANIEILK